MRLPEINISSLLSNTPRFLKIIFRRNNYRLLIGYLIFRAAAELGLYFERELAIELYSLLISFLGELGGFVVLLLKIFVFTDNLWVFLFLFLMILLLIRANHQLEKLQNNTNNTIEKRKIKKSDLENYLRKQVDKQLQRHINSGKYIPELYIERSLNRELIRYTSYPVLFSKKVYNNIKAINLESINKILRTKKEKEFQLEIEKIDKNIKVEKHGTQLKKWAEHLEIKIQQLKETNIWQNDRSFYESKIYMRLEDISYLKAKMLLVLDNAGQGKTNLICDFTNRFLLGHNIPSIFLTGNEINSIDIRSTILNKIFPNQNNIIFDDFIKAVKEMCLSREKLFIILIDGLNENLNTSEFSSTLEDFLFDIKEHEFIKIIATCRKDYYKINFINIERAMVWDEIKTIDNLSFMGEKNQSERLLHNYMAYFNINYNSISENVYIELTSNFLLLRIFCETHSGKKFDRIDNLFRLDLFRSYYEIKCDQINKRIKGNDEYKLKGEFNIRNLIKSIVEFMVTNNQYTNVPLEKLIKDKSEIEIYTKFLDENVLIRRDPKKNSSGIFGNIDVVNFTFDEFRDFLISSYLVEDLYQTSNSQFDFFISKKITISSQIYDGCTIFLFYLSRENENIKLKNSIYKQKWFNGVFISSVFNNIQEEKITTDDINRIVEIFKAESNFDFLIVDGLINRYSAKEFKKLNISLLFELLNDLDESAYNKKFIQLFDYSYNPSGNTISLKKLIDELDLLLEEVKKEKLFDSQKHNLFNLLIYLFPNKRYPSTLEVYKKYFEKYSTKAKSQLRITLQSTNLELKNEIKLFCEKYAMELL